MGSHFCTDINCSYLLISFSFPHTHVVSGHGRLTFHLSAHFIGHQALLCLCVCWLEDWRIIVPWGQVSTNNYGVAVLMLQWDNSEAFELCWFPELPCRIGELHNYTLYCKVWLCPSLPDSIPVLVLLLSPKLLFAFFLGFVAS